MAQPAMLSRRALLAAGTGLVAAPALLTPALAQGRWPDRPVRFLQGFAAGGTTDIVARLIAPSMAAA
ncbi:MAG: tripartite tricarboxylate transporter substrate binding protein, partial [Roseomonas sp.]|nr:tripartite tricarboxylate transporter substrate binding protein [Roseomonas sp.]